MTDIEDLDARTRADLAMTEMLKQIVAPIVDDPLAVAVQAVRDGDDVTFVVQMAEADLGWFSGPMARTGESLRVIVKAAGLRAKRRFFLAFETIEPAGGDDFGDLSRS